MHQIPSGSNEILTGHKRKQALHGGVWNQHLIGCNALASEGMEGGKNMIDVRQGKREILNVRTLTPAVSVFTVFGHDAALISLCLFVNKRR